MEDDITSIDLDEAVLAKPVNNSCQVRFKNGFKFGISNVPGCDQKQLPWCPG